MTSNRPVQFGIIGLGRIAGAYVSAIRAAANAELAAAASRELARAEAVQPRRAYADYYALLDDPDVEAVYIATHNGLHHRLTMAALARGKHVLCEKPLANDAAQCAEMVEAARKANRHLVEAFMYRFHPSIREAKRLIAEGAIGELRTVEAAFSYRMQSTTDVRLNRDWGGGALLDVGTYCVNACRYFFDAMPQAVTAIGDFHPQHDVDMALHGLLEFSPGRCGVISCGFDAGRRNRVLLCATDGTLELPMGFGTNNIPVKLIVNTVTGSHVIDYEPIDTYRAQVEDLARAVRGAAPLLDAEEGRRNAVVIDALLASARQGASRVDVAS